MSDTTIIHEFDLFSVFRDNRDGSYWVELNNGSEHPVNLSTPWVESSHRTQDDFLPGVDPYWLAKGTQMMNAGDVADALFEGRAWYRDKAAGHYYSVPPDTPDEMVPVRTGVPSRRLTRVTMADLQRLFPASRGEADVRWKDLPHIEEWQNEVAALDTLLGYREWVSRQDSDE